jgi:uncharacterized protein (TIGR02594 family)
MTALKVKDRTKLRKDPQDNALPKKQLEGEEILKPTGKTSGEWTEVIFSTGVVDIRGWVLTADCETVTDIARELAETDGFIHQCIFLERVANSLNGIAPWFVTADFVIARAILETKITNLGPNIAGSDGVGPLQVTTAEWDDFLSHAPSELTTIANNKLTADHRDDWMKQIRSAIYRMRRDAKAISEAQRRAGVGSEADPFLPSLLDVFHAYLFDSAEAAVAVHNAEKSAADKDRKIDTVLRGPLDDKQLESLFKARPQNVGTSDQPKTVATCVAATETALNDALKMAFDLIAQFSPDDVPVASKGEAPWFDVALEEEEKNIDEHDPNDKDTILDYFKATSLGRPSAILPWCGAFAAHCMKASGNDDVAASVPSGAAAAVSWRNWGDTALAVQSDIPQGAVVVLSPSEGTGTTGHVGFFVRFLDDGKRIELLGGNQSDKLTRTAFKTSKVAAIRWMDLGPAAASEQFAGTASTSKISPEAIKLIEEFEVSGKERYESKLRHPIWPEGSSGVTIGIGYDVGHTSTAQLNADWKNVIPDAMLARLEACVGVKGAAAKALADGLRSQVDVPYDAAIKVYRECMLPRWVGIVEKVLPNTSMLKPHALGALVSLTLNRGQDYTSTKDRRREMVSIKRHMENKQFDKIPAEIRAMTRLWPSSKGLRRRREAEAKLFEAGLT